MHPFPWQSQEPEEEADIVPDEFGLNARVPDRSHMHPSVRTWDREEQCYTDVYDYRYYDNYVVDDWNRRFPYPPTGAHSRGDGRENYQYADDWCQEEADRLERGHRYGWHTVGRHRLRPTTAGRPQRRQADIVTGRHWTQTGRKGNGKGRGQGGGSDQGTGRGGDSSQRPRGHRPYWSVR